MKTEISVKLLIDFKLLKKQKDYLINLKHNDNIDGLLSIIDEIQDIAVDECGYSEKDVFKF